MLVTAGHSRHRSQWVNIIDNNNNDNNNNDNDNDDDDDDDNNNNNNNNNKTFIAPMLEFTALHSCVNILLTLFSLSSQRIGEVVERFNFIEFLSG